MQTLDGYFDGKVIVLDVPANLKPNTRVKILAPDAADEQATFARDFMKLSEPAFQKIWDNPLDADYDRI